MKRCWLTTKSRKTNNLCLMFSLEIKKKCIYIYMYQLNKNNWWKSFKSKIPKPKNNGRYTPVKFSHGGREQSVVTIYTAVYASIQCLFTKILTKCPYIHVQCINKLYNYLQYIFIYIQKSLVLDTWNGTSLLFFDEGSIK